jgi:FMN reductase
MSDIITNLRFVAVGGSLRENSCSYLALEYLTNLLIDLGCEAQILDLRLMNLPFCNGDNLNPRTDYPAVGQLRSAVSSAHGLILASPEYHGGISGVLKNTLDLLSAEHLKGKVAGVVSVLGGTSNSNALNDLGRILRCCHAWVLPEYIAVPRAHSVFLSGSITDADLRKRFNNFAHSLVWSAARIAGYNTLVA